MKDKNFDYGDYVQTKRNTIPEPDMNKLESAKKNIPV